MGTFILITAVVGVALLRTSGLWQVARRTPVAKTSVRRLPAL
jgi:hypothetical protein